MKSKVIQFKLKDEEKKEFSKWYKIRIQDDFKEVHAKYLYQMDAWLVLPLCAMYEKAYKKGFEDALKSVEN